MLGFGQVWFPSDQASFSPETRDFDSGQPRSHSLIPAQTRIWNVNKHDRPQSIEVCSLSSSRPDTEDPPEIRVQTVRRFLHWLFFMFVKTEAALMCLCSRASLIFPSRWRLVRLVSTVFHNCAPFEVLGSSQSKDSSFVSTSWNRHTGAFINTPHQPNCLLALTQTLNHSL